MPNDRDILKLVYAQVVNSEKACKKAEWAEERLQLYDSALEGIKYTLQAALGEVQNRRILNDREVATILHALRVLQLTCSANDEACDHFDDCKILSDDEIDALCESINLDDVSVSAWTLKKLGE